MSQGWFCLKYCCFALMAGLFCGNCETHAPGKTGGDKLPYGVFIGLSPEQGAALFPYRLAVIDGACYSAGEIAALRQGGVELYSYLNIGSIETFRGYYGEFAAHTLGDYEGWPDEKWMDLSYEPWRQFVVDKLAGDLAAKGIDGFFVDNADVYYFTAEHFPPRKQDIYEGLGAALAGLAAHKLPVIINGGDAYIREALEAGSLSGAVKGVNQECVFTSVTSYKKGTFGRQKREVQEYCQAYLEDCKKAGLQVYLVEYMAAKSGPLVREIDDYCRKNQFLYYIAPRLSLDGDF